MLSDPLADEFLDAYLEATDRYTSAVDELSRLADGKNHVAFLVSHERVRTLATEADEARFAMIEHREWLKRSA